MNQTVISTRKIIFLDYDGVLHPSHFQMVSEFSKVPLFENLVLNHYLSIVISSSWRFHYPMSVLKEKLGKKLSDSVIGAIGEAKQTKHARFDEISDWLEFHPECDWRAVDDSKFEFPMNCKNLILCDSRVGIDHQQIGSLDKWLKN